MASKTIPEHLHKPNKKHVFWLYRRIWDQINVDSEHFMLAIVGREGSGKSYTAMKIAHRIDPSFTAERVLFDVADLLEVLKAGDHERGQFYVLDEAGVQFGRRTWQERGQVLANQCLQLIRNHHLGLIFTLPRLGELDSQTQGRLHAFFEIVEKEQGEYVKGKWKRFDPDRADVTGKTYHKYPVRKGPNVDIQLTRFSFTPPPDDLTAEYESRKRDFQERFYGEVIDKLRGAESENGDNPEAVDTKSIANEIVEDGQLDEYVKEHGGNGRKFVSEALIRAEHDLTNKQVEEVKALLEKELA